MENSNRIYKLKYLKYKTKYLNLKKQIYLTGGAESFIDRIKNVVLGPLKSATKNDVKTDPLSFETNPLSFETDLLSQQPRPIDIYETDADKKTRQAKDVSDLQQLLDGFSTHSENSADITKSKPNPDIKSNPGLVIRENNKQIFLKDIRKIIDNAVNIDFHEENDLFNEKSKYYYKNTNEVLKILYIILTQSKKKSNSKKIKDLISELELIQKSKEIINPTHISYNQYDKNKKKYYDDINKFISKYS